MDGATNTIRHILTGNMGLERVELSMFSLCFKNPDIFLANERVELSMFSLCFKNPDIFLANIFLAKNTSHSVMC
jgi:hypothetical protein